jgi:hypothetical protein
MWAQGSTEQGSGCLQVFKLLWEHMGHTLFSALLLQADDVGWQWVLP